LNQSQQTQVLELFKKKKKKTFVYGWGKVLVLACPYFWGPPQGNSGESKKRRRGMYIKPLREFLQGVVVMHLVGFTPHLNTCCYEHRPLGEHFKHHMTVGITLAIS